MPRTMGLEIFGGGLLAFGDVIALVLSENFRASACELFLPGILQGRKHLG